METSEKMNGKWGRRVEKGQSVVKFKFLHVQCVLMVTLTPQELQYSAGGVQVTLPSL